MGHVHSRNRLPRAGRKESLTSLPFRISGREKGRKRETDEEEGSEWREKSNVCCRHANSCWTATWKGLVGSSDLTARNLCEIKSADTNAIARHIEGVYAKRPSFSRQNIQTLYQKQAYKKHNYGEDIRVSQLRERGTAYKYSNKNHSVISSGLTRRGFVNQNFTTTAGETQKEYTRCSWIGQRRMVYAPTASRETRSERRKRNHGAQIATNRWERQREEQMTT
ncbi:hypothetical protein ALC62_13893 [Cyphomyrmex costatus]|uniref:Uncharacterized protein n=1 Tax=Cyphomyrmex costatus TaxID=456900 RepID=A0A195C4C2_9HYME|nr:hypothetical protein ALC62_13893 [Cyphomyrmex costatus]